MSKIYQQLADVIFSFYLRIRNKNVINTKLKNPTLTEDDNMINAFNHLLACQIKPSQQRIAIMEYLLKYRTHPSVEEIYKALSPSMPTLSKTTVYNTLKLFNEQGAVQILTIDERNACFDGDMSLHAHFLCKKCGHIYDIDMDEMPEETLQIESEGHTVSEVHHYYKGLCKACMQKEKEV